MKRVFAVGAAVLGMLAFTTGAGAITYGVPDGDGHPEVGALLAQQAHRRNLGDLLRDADRATHLSDRRTLRRGRQSSRGHVRFLVGVSEWNDVLGHVACGPGLQPGTG
jgi:hypothetical protein